MFSGATCSVQLLQQGKMKDWNISGTAQVTGLNPQNASTTVTFTFETRPNKNANWAGMNITSTITTNGVNGTANFNTSNAVIGAPAQGQQYRVLVSGSYIDGTGKQVPIPGIGSTPITPNP